MSRRPDVARKWTCGGCGVSASRIDGDPTPLPESWTSSAEGELCLSCRRQQAAEAAVEAAPSDSGRDARAKLRRAGLIEFEVRRTPGLTDGTIAKACRSSASAVAAARQRLQLRKGPAAGSDRNLTAAHRRAAVRH
ncbi:MAG TPA: hypothetical protein VHQ43_10365 [Solirubrobacterales bacterium]|jgi:hypothetical protein|nr:hypothetical protein [Solirubrobacterales bacterium]